MTDTTGQGGQSWSAEGYARNARFVADLAAPVVDLLDPHPGERILDLGCGDGVLTQAVVARGAVVVGADSSAPLVAAARARGIDARLADGQRLDFAGEFDAVFTNAALHWMPDADAVIDGVRRALRPGGRFVGEFGGHGNVAAIATALIAAVNARGVDGAARFPWFFPTAEDYAARLEAHGFQVVAIGLHPRPTPLPTGIEGWLETFAGPFLAGFDDAARAAALNDAIALLAPSLRDPAGGWTADYVRLRFAARLRR